LLSDANYQVFISGNSQDRSILHDFLKKHRNKIIDITGKMSLSEFIAFIHSADALVAASTGPLHIAAALGKIAIGLYSPMRPIHPGRWGPVGKRAHSLALNIKCNACRYSKDCECIRSIAPESVKEILDRETNKNEG
jgi:ADP-heptose:LPS heptosyltransferase